MVTFHDMSIRLKLTLVIVFTSVLTLSLASVIFIFNDKSSYRQDLAERLTLLSHILADNSASALEFDDTDTARELLNSIGRDDHIVWAAITRTDGSVFSQFHRTGDDITVALPARPEDGFAFNDNFLTIAAPILDNDTESGVLWIQSDLTAMDARATWFLGVTGIVLLVGSIVGLIVAFLFQRVISRPIGELARGARQLAVGNVDYEIAYQSKDEIGGLADTFRSLKDYVETLSDAAERIAARNLRITVEPRSEKDVLGNSFRSMISSLREMIQQFGQSAGKLSETATEIAETSTLMSDGTREQADTIAQVATAIEEMTRTIVESSQNAAQANNASRQASETANTGGEIVAETIQGMQSIAAVVRESASTVSNLAESAEQIGKIINVIDDIADQTNLLALNAAIEAARAGEQGRGFAVVADEVRKLAERTGKATGEITELIKKVQDKTAEAVMSMESGIAEVDKGRELTDNAGTSLSEIVTMSQQVMSMIEQIATASEEQSQVAEGVSQRIEQISSVTSTTAQQAGGSSQAAEMLNRNAEELQRIIDSFKV